MIIKQLLSSSLIIRVK